MQEPKPDYLRYWGKAAQDFSWHPLVYHSLDVAACAVALIERHPRIRRALHTLIPIESSRLAAIIGWAAALHDLGKFSPGFQWKVPEIATTLGRDEAGAARNETYRHDSLGYALWLQHIEGALNAKLSGAKAQAKLLLGCATGHHGSPPSLQPTAKPIIRAGNFFTAADKAAAAVWAEAAFQIFQPDLSPVAPNQLKRASWWIAGLVTLADWLGSSTEWFPYASPETPVDQYFLGSCERATLALTESGVLGGRPPRGFSELFPKLAPSPVQSAVVELAKHEPFLLIVEEMTGGGKTEAAIAAAGGAGFFFGLPTMATANGLWHRLQDLGGEQTLVHGKRWLMPRAMERAAAWVNDSPRKALLADVGVGTVDQAMMAALPTRFGCLRLAGLAGKTLVIDELHAYDPYMTRVLERLVEAHAQAGGSVVLLSATLPLQDRALFSQAWAKGAGVPPPSFDDNSFPCVSVATAAGAAQRALPAYRSKHCQLRRESSLDAVIAKLRAVAQAGFCSCWIRNTVDEAVAAYDRLRQAGIAAELFHARFTAGDRVAIEASVLNHYGKQSTPSGRAGRVLVATQVVEQSLDLDFDFMATDLAPVDLLIQRAGRLQRHARGSRIPPELWLHCPAPSDSPTANWVQDWSPGTARIYPDHGKLWLGLQALGDRLSLPDDARRLIETVYGEAAAAVPPGLEARVAQAANAERRQALAGLNNRISFAAGYSADGSQFEREENVPTRLGPPSQEWVLFEGSQPLNGTLELSVISLPLHRLRDGPVPVTDLPLGWRKALQLHDGVARCSRSNGQFEFRYNPQIGAHW